MQYFNCDYMEGAHPAILERLAETNYDKTEGYGVDPYTDHARELIREAVGCPEAEVHFLVGGTQTNEAIISAFLRSYEGVIAPTTGHVNCHEAGAIEHGGHKVLAIPDENGKLTAEAVRKFCWLYYKDMSWEHMVRPGMVYVSQPILRQHRGRHPAADRGGRGRHPSHPGQGRGHEPGEPQGEVLRQGHFLKYASQ